MARLDALPYHLPTKAGFYEQVQMPNQWTPTGLWQVLEPYHGPGLLQSVCPTDTMYLIICPYTSKTLKFCKSFFIFSCKVTWDGTAGQYASSLHISGKLLCLGRMNICVSLHFSLKNVKSKKKDVMADLLAHQEASKNKMSPAKTKCQ